MNRPVLVFSIIISLSGAVLALLNLPWAWMCFCAVSIYWFVYGQGVNNILRQVAQKHSMGDSSKANRIIHTLDESLAHAENQLKSMIQAMAKIGEGEVMDSSHGLVGSAKESVVALQSKLRGLREDEMKRTWSAEGNARITEIRKKQNTLEDYAFDTLSTLVKYLDANQGSFYLLDTTEQREGELDLLATYAYDRKKYTDKKVKVGINTGLLGQSILDKNLIVIKEIPKDYVKITSGLGQATPRCIVITPLMFRDEIYGVIEMASFQQFENHHLDFIRRVSETIASELSSIHSQKQTNRLLEQAQQQATELRSKEEEMRQNIEEMKATEEEMKRNEIELQKKLKEVENERQKSAAILNGCMDGVISFTEEGTIVFANKVAQEIFEREQEALIGEDVESLLQIHIHENAQGKKVVDRNGNEVGTRTEVMAKSKRGDELALLLTITRVDLEDSALFTIFIQKISVELF